MSFNRKVSVVAVDVGLRVCSLIADIVMKRLTSPVSVVNYMSLVTQKSCQSDTHWQAMLFIYPIAS
jgi:hypothetical protein